MSFITVLQKIGQDVKKFFDELLPLAKAAEPVVDLALPGIGELYNATVAMVSNAEMTATAAGKQSGTGAQKLALVVSSLEPLAVAYFKAQGITADQTVITNWVNAVVASLNAIPAPATPA